MAITFLEDEPAAPTKRKVTFLEDEPPARLFAAPEPAPEPRTRGQALEQTAAGLEAGIGRAGLAFAKGTIGGVKAFSDVLGANNAISKKLAGVEDYLDSLMSAQSQNNQEEIGRIFDEAESKGLKDKIVAGLEAFTVAPEETLAQAGGYMLPNIAAGVLGKAAQLGKLGVTALQAGTGATQATGIIKGEIYRGVTDYLREQGMPEDQIEKIATEAQAYGGENLDQILIGAGLGAVAASTGAERIITRMLTRTGKEVSKKSVGSVLKGIAAGGLAEAATEFPQEAQEQVAQNVALQRIGADVPTFKGAIQAGAMGAAAGFVLGGGAGAVEVMTAEEKAEAEINRDADKEARNLTVPAGDANAKAVVNEVNRMENDIAALREVYDQMDPASPEAQNLVKDIANAQKRLAGMKQQLGEPLTEVEAQQAELATTLAEEPLSSTITEPSVVSEEGALVSETTPAPTISEIPQTSEMIGAEPTQPAPAEGLPADTSATILNYDERVKPIQDRIDAKIDELMADGMTFEEADTSPEVAALYEERFAMDRGAINSYRDIVNQAFADQGITQNDLTTTPARAIIEDVYAAPREGSEGLISVIAESGQQAFDNDAATIKKLAEVIFKHRAEAEGLSPEGLLGPQSALTKEGKKARVDEARVAAEAIHNQIKNALQGPAVAPERTTPVSRIRRGESGAMLIPTREDFVDLGKRIYEKGMQFKAWADRMIAEFGDAVRQFLGDIWKTVSGIPAKLEELAGYLPGKGEVGAVNIRGQQLGPVQESPEGQTIPEAMAKGIDIGPENNMPINRKIDSHLKNFLFLRGVFESASDRLRRNGFVKLGDAVDSYFDRARERLAVAQRILGGAFDEFAGSKEKKRIDEDVQKFYAAQENKRDTAPIRAEMHPTAIKIVDSWQEFGEVSGKDNQNVDVKVYEPDKGTWRPIGRLKRFFPRQIKPEYERALREPDKYAKEYNEIVEALIENGNIKTPDEAERFLKRYRANEFRNDYFSGIEMARGLALPEKLYDYSMSVMTNYIARWAQHTSRIEAFGQKTTKESKTMWDREMESTRDPKTIDYIQAVKDRVEGMFPNDPYLRGMAALNIWATGLQLGNPASAILNLIGGSTLNAMIGQPGAAQSYVESLIELRNLGQQMQDARETGILSRDLMNIVGDHQSVLDSNGFALAGSKVADFLLKWGGFTPTEQMIRTQSFIIGKSFLRNALRENLNNPNSSFSRRARAFLTRNNFDLDKLVVENGNGPETNKLLRYFSNISQGSYTIDQVPAYIDMPVGKFLFKYQKFSTQVMRMAWKNTFEPAWKAATGRDETVQLPNETRQILYRLKLAEAKELGDTRPISLDSIPKKVGKAQARALTMIPAMMWLASAYVGGEVLLRMRDILFGVLMKGPEYDDMLKALEDDDEAAAVYMGLERAWYNLIGIGALGFLGNYAQFFLDWSDRERVKNPLDPPALGVATEFGNLATTLIDQGTLTGGDISDFATKQVSAYRATKKLAQSTAGWMGMDDIPGVKEEMFRREVASINKYARRWAEDSGIEYRMRRPGDVAATARTPINRKIAGFLQSGEPEKAAVFAREYLNTLPREDRKNAIQSMTTGARNRQPLRLGSGPMTDTERKAFLRWMKDKVSDEKYQKVVELDRQYQRDYRRFLSRVPNR